MKLSQISLLAVVGIISASTAAAETKISAGGLSIKIAPQDGRYVISVNGAGNKEIKTGSAFALSNPPRIVVDLPNYSTKGSVTKKVGLEGISSVRIGSHPDKTRVVFDLTQGTSVDPGSFNAKTTENSVVLSLNAPTVFAKSKTKTQVQAKAKKVEPKPVEVAKASVGGQELPSAKVEPTQVALQTNEATAVAPSVNAPQPNVESVVGLNAQEGQNSPLQGANIAAVPAAGEPSMIASAPSTVTEGGNSVASSETKLDVESETVALNTGAESIASGSPAAESESPQVASLEVPAANSVESGSEELSGALVSEVSTGEATTVATAESESSSAANPTTELAGNSDSTDAQPVVARAMVDSQQATPPPVSGDTGAVKGIYFRAIEPNGDPGLFIETSGLQNYWFSRKDKKLFEITLENTQLGGDFLKLAQFPPNKFQGFEAVSAEQRGKDSVVKVFVGEEYRIAPYRKEGQLWVKVMK